MCSFAIVFLGSSISSTVVSRFSQTFVRVIVSRASSGSALNPLGHYYCRRGSTAGDGVLFLLHRTSTNTSPDPKPAAGLIKTLPIRCYRLGLIVSDVGLRVVGDLHAGEDGRMQPRAARQHNNNMADKIFIIVGVLLSNQ